MPPTFSAQGNNNEVDIGNPDLKPSRANNYDLLYEKYLKPLGMLQGGFFFKQLSNPIYESVKSVLTSSLAQQYGIDPNSTYVTDGWVLACPLNGKSATMYRFEIAYQQHLSFLPGPFSGVGLSANYGYTHSSTTRKSGPPRTDLIVTVSDGYWSVFGSCVRLISVCRDRCLSTRSFQCIILFTVSLVCSVRRKCTRSQASLGWITSAKDGIGVPSTPVMKIL